MWGNFWVHVRRLPPPIRVPPLIPWEGTAVLAMHDTVGFVCDVRSGEATRARSYYMLSDGSPLCGDCIKGHECYRSNPNAVLAVVHASGGHVQL